ncbi:MAG: DNA-binding protein [Candidatus Aenigmarchaeota archaeon]|nr:DNA-binding protein [Candidatus Aenigmarchaeota archaeon]
MADDEAAMRKNILSRALSKEAYERLSRVRAVKPELAAQLETYMVTLFQSGQIKTEISDEQLKQILDKVTQKKEFRIRRA